MIQMNEIEPSRREITTQALNLLGIKYKSRDSEAMVSCPFHKDKTPSMGIDLDTGRVHCFSCGYSGSIETLFKDITGNNLKQVLGISRDPFSSFASGIQVRSFKQYKNIDALKTIYVNYNSDDFIKAEENPKCFRYLLDRGLTRETIENMGILYVEESRVNTTLFKRRAVIPIYEKGRLISLEGRRIFKEDPDPKVLYPKNTSVNTLYDIDNLNKKETLFACEGLMDLAVLRSGSSLKNSTSIFGANLSDRQLNMFKQFKEVVYIPDSDAAGDKTVEKLKNSNLDNIYILKLPKQINDIEIKDIGDLPKAGITVEDLIDRKWLSYIKKLI